MLREALISILAQSYTDYEIIVVDNCSPDDTEAVVAALGNPRIKFHRNALNVGPVNNHNRALRLATGHYICTFSDDDVMLPDNLAAKVAILDQHPQVGLVHSMIHTINEMGTVVSTEQWAKKTSAGERLNGDELMAAQEAYDLLYEGWNFICMPSVLVRRSILAIHQLEFNNQLGYLIDWDLWLKISKHASFYYIKVPLVKYRIHSSNESARMNTNLYFKEIFLMKLSLLTLHDKDNNGRAKVMELSDAIDKQIAQANLILHPETVAPTPPLWRKAWKYMPLKMQIKQILGRP